MEVHYAGTTRNYTRVYDPWSENGYYVAPKEKPRKTDPYWLNETQQQILEVLKAATRPLLLGEIAAEIDVRPDKVAADLKRLSLIEPIYEEGREGRPFYAYLNLEE